MQYARVVLSLKNKEVDKLFDYAVPEQFSICVGVRVLVPFGKGNKQTEGYVVELSEETDVPYQFLKNIEKVLDEGKPIFTKDMIAIAYWMQEKYFCTLSQCLQTMLPAGIKTKSQWQAVLLPFAEEKQFSSVEKNLIAFLEEKKGQALVEDIEENFGKMIQNTIRRLKEQKVIQLRQKVRQKQYVKEIRLLSLVQEPSVLDTFLEQVKKDKRLLGQKKIVEYLANGKAVTMQELKDKLMVTDSPVRTLLKKGILQETRQEQRRQVLQQTTHTEPFVPTEEQARALEVLSQELGKTVKKPVLLHGITGSGKTEIYLQMIEKVVAKGKQAIVLVPEISLTPQMVERFVARFGEQVSVTHSRMNYGERYDQWKKARDHEISIMIGPRSALFLPFDNLGIIIIDEEHEGSYRSDLTPKYDAKEVAEVLSQRTKSLLILGSATPDLVTYHKAVTGEYLLVELTKRTKGSHLPQVSIVDMRQELESGNRSVFGKALKEAIRENLSKKQQTILFLNRRGYATFVSCRQCGYVMKCDECEITYTYHAKENELVCHYCGKRIPNPTVCPACGSRYIKYFGTGTQKIEEETKKLFPEARVLRMDLDTTTGKNSHQKLLEQFTTGKADILIGTQMIAKGHDFPNVTLVGIVAADLSLHMGSYQASETCFQLVTQAAGRAGRDELPGTVFIQTYSPDHYSILAAAKQDYKGFYEKEIQLRKLMNYPPFAHIFAVVLSGKKEQEVIESARYLADCMVYYNRKGRFQILGPTPAALSKFRQEYRWRILVKCKEETALRNFVLYCCETWKKRKNWEVLLQLTMNPTHVV